MKDSIDLIAEFSKKIKPAECIEDALDNAEVCYEKADIAKEIKEKFHGVYIAGETTSTIGIASIVLTTAFAIAKAVTELTYGEVNSSQLLEIGGLTGASALGVGLLGQCPHWVAQKAEDHYRIKGAKYEISAVKRSNLVAAEEISAPYVPTADYQIAYQSLLDDKLSRQATLNSYNSVFDEMLEQKRANIADLNAYIQSASAPAENIPDESSADPTC